MSFDFLWLRDHRGAQGGGGQTRSNAVGRPIEFLPPPQNKKPSHPAKSENEGIHRNPVSHPRTRPASSFSLRRSRLRPDHGRNRDERCQTGILTSGINRAPAFPLAPVFRSQAVAMGSFHPVTVAQPFRIFTGFPDIWLR